METKKALILIILITLGIFFIGPSFSNQSFVQYPTEFFFIALQGLEQQGYINGENSITHLTANQGIASFKFNEQTYSASNGQITKLNELLSVKPQILSDYINEKEYIKIVYSFIISTNDVITITSTDSQQKLIGGDTATIQVCNNAGITLEGGFDIIETYDKVPEAIASQKYFVIKKGCNNYVLPLQGKYLGPANIKITPYIIFNNYDTEWNEVSIKPSKFSQYTPCAEGERTIGTSTTSSGLTLYWCGDPNDYNTKEMKPTLIKTTKTFYDSNSYILRVSFLTEKFNQTSLDCTKTSCPTGYSCDSYNMEGKEYNICNKKGLVDSFNGKTITSTPTKQVPTHTTPQTVDKTNYTIIFIIAAIVFIAIIFLIRR